jgi:hypothetical protein
MIPLRTKKTHFRGIEEATMETAKKGLVDVAVNVGGKSVASGKMTIGSTNKNKKGLIDLSVDIGDDTREAEGEATGENKEAANTAARKGRFAFSLGLLPSAAGELLKIGVNVLGGEKRKSRRRHSRNKRNHASPKKEQS